jgi:DNA mismatch repair protein MutL
MTFQNPSSSVDWTQAPRQPFAGSPGSEHGRPTPFAPTTGPDANPLMPMSGSTNSSEYADAFDTSRLDGANADARFDSAHSITSSPTQTASALQVHNTYLISETEEGMIVIDQHALHERIIYEQIRDKVLNGKLESQKLLVPEPVSLPPAEAAAVLEQAELLSQLGITVEPFGGDTVLVSAYPAMLANHNPAEMLRGVVDQIVGGAKQLDQRDMVDELLHMIKRI